MTGTLLTLFWVNAYSQCSLLDNNSNSVYITFERTARVKVDGQDKLQRGIVLRLHNNLTCTIIVTTGTANGFYKPLPPNPTPLQLVKREIDYDLPDGALVPELQYRYQTRKESGISVGGDMFFGFSLLGGHTILFEVPFKHLDPTFASVLMIEFKYPWDLPSSDVKNSVGFWIGSLPDALKIDIAKHN